MENHVTVNSFLKSTSTTHYHAQNVLQIDAKYMQPFAFEDENKVWNGEMRK